ncbi:unnamed protein product (macronuclear) [Paramecium tetraurelia]|uniref:HORMA domain-containing protein n=1 Tax=Paramecium tetraurelia TaxID=5888 RepID=A0D393_PARTE|nr:uncharacterized protein GSPATT00012995001 [Paramecium tetraurelia]CAK77510.1 unnamed protein product [Paramecium tetraurelia]|eukprot:XP_001444907.1 hypothetical protein (macronuclear) [Paramecium tetraurelia strain d4-2]
MFQTTSSINSQQSPNRFKFKSKVSFFNDNMMPAMTTKITLQYKEFLRNMISSIQEKTSFVNFLEFDQLKSQQIGVSIQSCYNPKFKSTGVDETKEAFQDLLDEIKQTINRKYPFIKVFRQQISHPDHYLQIQLYQPEVHSVVLYSRQYSKEQISPKLIADLVWLHLRKFNLTVNVDCPIKNVVPVSEEGQQRNILEGLQVTVRQREAPTLQSAQTPTKQIVIRTSFCQQGSAQKSASKLDIYKSTENIRDMEKSVRVYFSPTKSQAWMTQTNISQIDLSGQKQRAQSPEKKFTVKLFSQTVPLSCFDEAKFIDLVQQVNAYEIEITGNCIQTMKTQLNVDELLDDNTDTVYVSTRVERNDVIKCIVKAPEDATVNVTKNITETLTFDSNEQAFVFYGRDKQEYVIDVSKKDCFSQKRTVFLQGNTDVKIEFDLVSCVETTLQFRAYNILLRGGQHKDIENCRLEIFQSDQTDQEPLIGMTNDQGQFSCPGLMFKQVRVHAQRKGFLQVSYDFDVLANSTGQLLNIPMIPDYYSLINQYHILIYVPNKNNFQLDFALVCPDGTKIDSKNRQHNVMKSKLEINRINQQTMLWNFSVHVQSLDPFLPDNCFQFFINNQKPKRTLLCQEPLSPQCKENGVSSAAKASCFKTVNLNEMFLKTRVMQTEIKTFVRQESDVIAQKINNYCAEESVRIFVTFGHKVLETFMIQSNLLMHNEKCFGVIDLDKRKFIRDNEVSQQNIKRNLSKMPTFKKDLKGGNEDRTMTTILQHITNQRFQE